MPRDSANCFLGIHHISIWVVLRTLREDATRAKGEGKGDEKREKD